MVVQLVRIPACHAGGRGFESRPLRQQSQSLPHFQSPDYVESLLEHWQFDERLKPARGFPVYYGWLGAISDAHAKVRRGLAIECPIPAMHSDDADIVLDWRHIARWSANLCRNVRVLAFPGGLHDLVLSRPEIREEVFMQLFAWQNGLYSECRSRLMNARLRRAL